MIKKIIILFCFCKEKVENLNKNTSSAIWNTIILSWIVIKKKAIITLCAESWIFTIFTLSHTRTDTLIVIE